MPSTLDFTIPHPLRNDAEYDEAHKEVLAILDSGPEPGTPEAERLEFLTILIQAYDAAHVRFGDNSPTTPQEIVEFVLERHGLSRSALVPLFGSKSRVSEFFSGRRDLSKTQIRELNERFGIPVDLLFEEGVGNTAQLSHRLAKLREAGFGGSSATKPPVRLAGNFAEISSAVFDVRPTHAIETTEHYDQIQKIQFDGLLLRIYARRIAQGRLPYWLLVIEREEPHERLIEYAFKLFPPDEAGFGKRSPIEMLEWMAGQFGVDFKVGDVETRFVLYQRIPVKSPDPQQFFAVVGKTQEFVSTFYIKVTDDPNPVAVCALGFCVDVQAYRRQLR